MKSINKFIVGIVGGCLLFFVIIIVLLIGRGPIVVLGNGPGYTGGEKVQMFGWLLGASVVALAYRAVPAIIIPLEKRTKRSLWFGIGWLASFGIASACVLLPRLFPWQSRFDSFGSLLVPGTILFMLLCLLVRAIWRSVLELNRR
jgi:hypothetical protein